MEWSIEKIDKVVAFINSELADGRAMKSIEIEEFSVNERVIHKRLDRLGYKKINNSYVLIDKKKDVIHLQDKSTQTKLQQAVRLQHKSVQTIPDTNSEMMIKLNSLNIDSLLELQQLVEPIKILFEDYKKRNEVIEVSPIEINITKNTTDTVTKSFRIDKDIAEKWENFTKANKQYKVQDLISMALDEYVNKYKK